MSDKASVTNKQFAELDDTFNEACRLANIPCTKRQASKFRNRKGIAYKTWKMGIAISVGSTTKATK